MRLAKLKGIVFGLGTLTAVVSGAVVLAQSGPVVKTAPSRTALAQPLLAPAPEAEPSHLTPYRTSGGVAVPLSAPPPELPHSRLRPTGRPPWRGSSTGSSTPWIGCRQRCRVRLSPCRSPHCQGQRHSLGRAHSSPRPRSRSGQCQGIHRLPNLSDRRAHRRLEVEPSRDAPREFRLDRRSPECSGAAVGANPAFPPQFPCARDQAGKAVGGGRNRSDGSSTQAAT